MNLFVGWNSWSVLEYLMTGEKVEDTYWYFKSGYYVDFKPLWLSKPFKPYEGQKIDKIYIPSLLLDEDYEYIKTLGEKEIFYLEEGEYDYIKYKDGDNHLFIPFYTMNPEKIANPEVFSELRKLNLTDEVTGKFSELYDIWLPEDKYDVILYTDPLEADFGITGVKEIVENYMKEHHSNERILVKAHPRDNTEWNWDICSHRLPAQLLLNRDVTHVFMYKTTVMRYLNSNNRYEEISINV